MSESVLLPLTSCAQCPHLTSGQHYSIDGFDRMVDWFCRHPDVAQDDESNKIAGAVEWHDKPAIPQFCPLREKNKKK